MTKNVIKLIQNQLNVMGYDAGPEDIVDQNPNDWPRQSPENKLIQYYSNVGEHQTRINLPYPHKLSWKTNQIVNSFQCHEKVHDSLHRVLSRVLDSYGNIEAK